MVPFFCISRRAFESFERLTEEASGKTPDQPPKLDETAITAIHALCRWLPPRGRRRQKAQAPFPCRPVGRTGRGQKNSRHPKRPTDLGGVRRGLLNTSGGFDRRNRTKGAAFLDPHAGRGHNAAGCRLSPWIPGHGPLSVKSGIRPWRPAPPQAALEADPPRAAAVYRALALHREKRPQANEEPRPCFPSTPSVP